MPPIYQPEVIARAAVDAVLNPQREMWIGRRTIEAILGQRVIPGFLDRYLANHAWSAQTTDRLPPGHPLTHTQDNVDGPLPGDRGAHGPFDGRAHASTSQRWLGLHLGWIAAAVVATAAMGTMLLLR